MNINQSLQKQKKKQRNISNNNDTKSLLIKQNKHNTIEFNNTMEM